MRSHPVYAAFQRRWQLPVYFQLRWKEIVSKLEDALTTTTIEPVNKKGEITTHPNQTALTAIKRSLCHRPGSCCLGGYINMLEC